MSKVNNLGIQYANGTVRMYLNDPVIELEIGSGIDTSKYRLKINGDTIGCETVAKLFIDEQVYTFADPYIKPSYQDKDWSEEEVAWKKKLGLDCFMKIQEAIGVNIVDHFDNVPFPSDDVIQKKKRQIEMQISRELYDKRKEREEEKRKREEERKLRENQQGTVLINQYPGITGNTGVSVVKFSDVITQEDDGKLGMLGIPFDRDEIQALKEVVKNMKPPV
jgi:hypothetical protein